MKTYRYFLGVSGLMMAGAFFVLAFVFGCCGKPILPPIVFAFIGFAMGLRNTRPPQ